MEGNKKKKWKEGYSQGIRISSPSQEGELLNMA